MQSSRLGKPFMGEASPLWGWQVSSTPGPCAVLPQHETPKKWEKGSRKLKALPAQLAWLGTEWGGSYEQLTTKFLEGSWKRDWNRHKDLFTQTIQPLDLKGKKSNNSWHPIRVIGKTCTVPRKRICTTVWTPKLHNLSAPPSLSHSTGRWKLRITTLSWQIVKEDKDRDPNYRTKTKDWKSFPVSRLDHHSGNKVFIPH